MIKIWYICLYLIQQHADCSFIFSWHFSLKQKRDFTCVLSFHCTTDICPSTYPLHPVPSKVHWWNKLLEKKNKTKKHNSHVLGKYWLKLTVALKLYSKHSWCPLSTEMCVQIWLIAFFEEEATIPTTHTKWWCTLMRIHTICLHIHTYSRLVQRVWD